MLKIGVVDNWVIIHIFNCTQRINIFLYLTFISEVLYTVSVYTVVSSCQKWYNINHGFLQTELTSCLIHCNHILLSWFFIRLDNKSRSGLLFSDCIHMSLKTVSQFFSSETILVVLKLLNRISSVKQVGMAAGTLLQ